MKRVLVIVYYFPPMGGSGVQRPLKIVKYLRDFGWEPVVLCPEPGAYHTFDESLQKELDETGVEVVRVKASTPFHVTGSRKNLQIGGVTERVLRFLSSFFWVPDNKKGWIQPCIQAAFQLMLKQKFDLIFASAPPYSNLMIGSELSKASELPFVADLRDDWVGSHLISYPTPWHRYKMTSIEYEVLSDAKLITTTNRYIADSLRSRIATTNPQVIQHGFDEADFNGKVEESFSEDKIHFMYSGMLYPKSNADIFFEAVKVFTDKHPEYRDDLRLHFQGNISDEYLVKARDYGLMEMVEVHGYLNHDEAVKNLMKADILWLNNEHPKNPHLISLGKTFEYMGSGKPVLAIIPEGSVKDELKRYGAAYIHSPGDPASVAETLEVILRNWRNNELPKPDMQYVHSITRREQCRKLAGLFDELV